MPRDKTIQSGQAKKYPLNPTTFNQIIVKHGKIRPSANIEKQRCKWK